MKAVDAATADLFAAAEPAGVPTPAVPTPAVPTSVVPHSVVPQSVVSQSVVPQSVVSQSPPATASPDAIARPAVPRRSTQRLWYAVVFPDLDLEGAPQRLERLCSNALQFTSAVSVAPPDALLLELQGSVKLFGSLARLHEDLDAVWRGLGLRARSATAPTTLGALWLARAEVCVRLEHPGSLAGALAPLPVAVIDWPEEHLRTLQAMGVRRLGELLRLPRSGIARRFGVSALNDLDVALGRQPAPRRLVVPRERFRERLDLETEVETSECLLEMLEPLIERCAHFLRERQAGVQSLELRLEHRARPKTRVRLGLASTTSAHDRFEDTLLHTLSRLELAAPVRSLELRSGRLEPLSAGSLDVFTPTRAGGVRDTAPQLIERLQARLGAQSVYALQVLAEHRPEVAWRRTEVAWRRTQGLACGARGVADLDSADGELAPERPLWLLDEPLPLPDAHRPCTVRGELKLDEGPERIESGWWDGRDIRRDYYRAIEPGGARLWVFRELKSGYWYLHGLFA